MMRFILPLVAFLVLVGFLAKGLFLHPHEVPSPLIDKPAPAFSLPRLDIPAKQFTTAEMKGKVWLLNVWASWCESCKDEHPVLLDLASQHQVPIYGLDYKDTPKDAKAWLNMAGNPYTLVAQDADGRVGINYGVYGVPETYVIDKQGIIRYKLIGPMTIENMKGIILPMVHRLEKQT